MGITVLWHKGGHYYCGHKEELLLFGRRNGRLITVWWPYYFAGHKGGTVTVWGAVTVRRASGVGAGWGIFLAEMSHGLQRSS